MRSVAHVVIDIDVAHLDRPFDYAIPPKLQGRVCLGSVVRVMWGGVRRTGWVVGVSTKTDYQGDLAPILLVLGNEPQFNAAMLRTYRYIALRAAATLSQVLSIAIPPRRAKVEAAVAHQPDGEIFADCDETSLVSAYPGEAFEPTLRAVVTAVPHMVLDHLAALIKTFSSQGVPVLVIVPTTALAENVYQWALQNHRGRADGSSIHLLTTNQSAADRYRAHLDGMHGEADLIIGTRMASWAATGKPAMMIVWDDASDHLRERRVPQVDALDIGVARARHEGFGLLAVGYSRSIKAQALVHSHWAANISPTSSVLRKAIPQVRVVGAEDFERNGSTTSSVLPDSAFQEIRKGLEEGPVLVQVPNATRVLTQTGLDGSELEEFLIGAGRVSRDLGRAFAQTRVVVSTAEEGVRREVVHGRVIVIATPGAEPAASNGYASVVCVHADSLVYSDRLSALEQASARWFSTLALAAPGAPVVLCGDIPGQIRRWLILWRPAELAEHLLQERIELGFFPAKWIIGIEGMSADVSAVVEALEGKSIETLAVLGTVVVKEDDETLFASTMFGTQVVRTFLACDMKYVTELMEGIRSIRASRSIARQEPVNIIVNPSEMF